MTTVEEPVADTTYPFAAVPPTEAAARYKAIAADRPMTKVTMPIGGDVWIIHRNSTARAMLSDPRFVREPFRTGERKVPYFVEFPDFLKTTIQFEDPPQHSKLRRLVQKSISPKRVRGMRDSAVEFANTLIGEMVAKGSPSNLVDDYAVALPIQMICNLLGVPPEDRSKFQKWSSATLAVANMPEEEVMTNMGELIQYMMALIDERRREPREDLLSDLANARDKDDSLTDAEIMPIALILIVAGFDNTANFICSGVYSLLNNPDQLAVLLEDVDGVAPTAVEEILRHGRFELGQDIAGSGGLVPFVATEDIELDGQLVAEGEAILVDPAATAHDGIAVEDGERFDVTRADNPHLTLSYGLHHCLGAPLARMEMQVGIAELFRRLPDIRLAGDVVVDFDNLVQPITSLPVAW
ncbi:cytochrome P450 [Rhodococcus sp. AD45-ID]|uniref:cytochrome P450 n=1 Tax=unclassified Rhodococcus (in: high G+C Gram-positive bacteria) TaxID=192944 RepID=UPI0005D3F736|nr:MULTISPECIES: cytochrome P450 [unclassified Rhodococcus (in: high G+C Gram-positive bacteria)]KJF24299.1 6-deoxyerythronolide B hydroxylase [Rhodococcus sp. AD45]PSR42611.1 cytochrome P450 [Rhodococcus sp. AD45-ID]